MRRRLLKFFGLLLALSCFAAMVALGLAWLKQATPDVSEPKDKPVPDPKVVGLLPPAAPHEASIPWQRSALHMHPTGLARATTPWSHMPLERMRRFAISTGECAWLRDPEREAPKKLAVHVELRIATSAWRPLTIDDIRLAVAAHPGPARLLEPGNCPWRSPLSDPPRVDLPVATVAWPAGKR